MIEINETVLGFYFEEKVEFHYDCVLAKHPAFPLIILWRFTECNSFHKLPVNQTINCEIIHDKPLPELSYEEYAMCNMFGNGHNLKWYKLKWIS